MSEEKRPFTVKDRRQFTADGEARESASTPIEAAIEASQTSSAPSAAPGPEPSAADEPVDFSSFLLSLGAQAAALLAGEAQAGLIPAAELRHARSLISILEMLKDKTEGRRTPEENRVVEGLLYELRMGYLARAGGA